LEENLGETNVTLTSDDLKQIDEAALNRLSLKLGDLAPAYVLSISGITPMPDSKRRVKKQNETNIAKVNLQLKGESLDLIKTIKMFQRLKKEQSLGKCGKHT